MLIRYLEGALSCNEIGQFSRNNDDISQHHAIQEFAAKSHAYTAEKARATYPPGNISDYWMAVRNILGQFHGVVEGYNRECKGTQWFHPLTEAQVTITVTLTLTVTINVTLTVTINVTLTLTPQP